MNEKAVGYTFPFHENEICHENRVVLPSNIDDKENHFIIGKAGMGMSCSLLSQIYKNSKSGKTVLVIDPKMEMTNPNILNKF